MEKPGCRGPRLVIACAVLLLGTVAFSCCVAAEFKKSKAAGDMRLDGNLCSLPRSSAFPLGITALLCLSLAQIAGTSAAGVLLCSAGNSWTIQAAAAAAASIAPLVLSWVSFGLAAVLLATASSMSSGQSYGRGWLDGDCYFVKDGVYIGSAVLAAATVIFILAFTFTATASAVFPSRRTGLDEAATPHHEFRSKCTAAARRG